MVPNGDHRLTPAPHDPAGTAIAIAVAFGAAGTFGQFYDVSWHRSIGRDSFWSLPHLFMYGGVLGISLTSIWALRSATVRPHAFGGPPVALGALRLPLGFLICVLGTLVTIASAPLDEWWHRTYGKDVLIWSFPHLLGLIGAVVIGVGLLFAVAAWHGSDAGPSAAISRTLTMLVATDLLQRMVFLLAHYMMVPTSRTPDYYPFLVSVLVPWVLVATARAIGLWAPVVIAGLHLTLLVAINGFLWLIDFKPYALTPLTLIPASVVAAVLFVCGQRGARWWGASLAGVAAVGVFYLTESAWMARVVDRAWPLERVATGLPASLIAGACSAWAGWALGGFLLVVSHRTSATLVFGDRRRATAAALALVALIPLAGAAVYNPQRPTPAVSAADLAPVPLSDFDYREATFWEVLLTDRWWVPGERPVYSEGIIDGITPPVGPAWCAGSRELLSRAWSDIRFGLSINGDAVDLARFPQVELRDRNGLICRWIGVGLATPRAGHHRFVYTIEYGTRVEAPVGTVGPGRVTILMTVVLKDP